MPAAAAAAASNTAAAAGVATASATPTTHAAAATDGGSGDDGKSGTVGAAAAAAVAAAAEYAAAAGVRTSSPAAASVGDSNVVVAPSSCLPSQPASAMELLAAAQSAQTAGAAGSPSALAARAAASTAAAAVITSQFGLGLATPETGRRRVMVSSSPARQALQLNCVGLGSYSRYGDQNGGRNLLVTRKAQSKASRNDYGVNVVKVASFSAKGQTRIPRPSSAASKRTRERKGRSKAKGEPTAVTSTVFRVGTNQHHPSTRPHASVDVDAAAAE